MQAIMTVTGIDHPGIVAAMTGELARQGINIRNISQTIMDQYFTMIVHCECDEHAIEFPELQRRLREVGSREGVDVRIQSSDIFDAMHRI